MKAMKASKLLILIINVLFFSPFIYGQNQEQQPQKTPIEVASEQAERLQKELNLKDYQLFLVDSVLQRNFTDLMNEVESMKVAGIQTRESYKSVQDKWTTKTDQAFEKIFDKEQFIKYLKMGGKYKAYKKNSEKEKPQ
ncbi:MAG: hypothetical protein HGA83_09100 [Bacteroidales bacterium]|nr:hypothetical protein [Bacteroidales bacterium]